MSWPRTREPDGAAVDDDLDEKRVFLQSIVDNIPLMVFVKEAGDLRFKLFNKAAGEILGVPTESMLGRNDFDFFPEQQARFFTEKDREVLREQALLDIAEEPIDTPRGRRFLHTRKIPIVGPDGRPLYLLGISEDITETKELQRLLETHRQALTEGARLSALGEMAGGIAHEINNPLAVVQGYANRLLRLSRGGAPIEAAAVAAVAQDLLATVHRITEIIRGLRSISREGSRDPMELVPLRDLVKGTLALCREKLRVHGIRVIEGEVDASVQVSGRPTELSQVLLNLLNNAHDAVLGGAAPWIEVACAAIDGTVSLSVTDSGPGVPPSARERLGQPFFTTKEPGKGTGLGLSISRAIVERHGGELVLDTEAAHTRFVVRLPRAGAEAETS